MKIMINSASESDKGSFQIDSVAKFRFDNLLAQTAAPACVATFVAVRLVGDDLSSSFKPVNVVKAELVLEQGRSLAGTEINKGGDLGCNAEYFRPGV